jgi:hypothetical protein
LVLSDSIADHVDRNFFGHFPAFGQGFQAKNI